MSRQIANERAPLFFTPEAQEPESGVRGDFRLEESGFFIGEYFPDEHVIRRYDFLFPPLNFRDRKIPERAFGGGFEFRAACFSDCQKKHRVKNRFVSFEKYFAHDRLKRQIARFQAGFLENFPPGRIERMLARPNFSSGKPPQSLERFFFPADEK
jgi:hypothetical protein